MPEHATTLSPQIDAAKREYDPQIVDRLLVASMEGDPVGDQVVTSFKGLPGGSGWQMLDQALLGEQTGAPPELDELLASLNVPPDWVELDLVHAGATAYWRAGANNVALSLMCGALAFGYQTARLTRPLAATGRLAQMAPRRLQETSLWMTAATRPGALRPGGEGLRATIRLRLVHALLRAHLLKSPAWDFARWGMPISASDSLLVAIGGFLAAPLGALEDLGVRFSAAEHEAMTHMWKYVASLMGVPDDLLPASFAEAGTIANAALSLDEGPNEDSSRLMSALLHNGVELPFESKLPAPVKRVVCNAKARLLGNLVRRWMDEQMADRLGVPSTQFSLMPVLRLVTRSREFARVSGLLGSDEHVVAKQLALVERAAARSGTLKTLEPSAVAREPVLPAI